MSNNQSEKKRLQSLEAKAGKDSSKLEELEEAIQRLEAENIQLKDELESTKQHSDDSERHSRLKIEELSEEVQSLKSENLKLQGATRENNSLKMKVQFLMSDLEESRAKLSEVILQSMTS